MDSFLEEPRKTPKPTPVIQEISSPIVPEVSLMFQNVRRDKAPVNMKLGKTMQSYNAWKLRSSPNNNTEYDSFIMTKANVGNKENLNNIQQMLEDRSLLSKKQVRFESPVQKRNEVLQYPSSRQNIAVSKMKKIPEVNLEMFSNSVTKNDTIINNRPVTSNLTPDNNKILTQQTTISRPFEKLYVSNIPNRELDLSFLEPAKKPCNFIGNDARTMLKRPITGLDHSTNTYNRTIPMPVLNNPPARSMNTPERADGRIGYYNNPEMLYTPSVLPQESIARNPTFISFPNTVPDLRRDSTFQQMHVAHREVPVNRIENQNIIEQSQSVPSEVNLNNSNTSENETTQSQTKENTTNAESTTNDSPSINDLLQIIKLQNDQLQMLQTQVDKLVKLNLKSAEEDNNHQVLQTQQEETVRFKDQQVGTSFLENREKKVVIREESVEHKNNKISVGLMTSFEVSFKPPVSKKKPKIRNIQPMHDVSINDVSFYENIRHHARSKPRSKPEVVKRTKKDAQNQLRVFPESWKRTNITEYSLGSQESLEVQEPPDSPDHSIHIDMQEYDTDDDDDTTMDPGWTFCRDIVGQVNNMCTNSAPENQENYRANGKYREEIQATDTTMHCIKQATLQHLQQDGFMQAHGAEGSSKPNDISFAVKQLLMKYLPDDGLANVATRNKQDQQQQAHRKPTDVSVATFKYMQQYNVVTNSPPYHGHKLKTNQTKKSSQRNTVDPKILDISTIKQQPKLL